MKRPYYGWIIAFIGTFVLATQTIAPQTSGIFLIPLTTQFGWERGVLSSAFSLSYLLGGVLGIFSGRLCDTYGPRILLVVAGLLTGTGLLLMSYIDSLWQVYLIWGLLIGVGRGCCVIPIVSTVVRWFSEKKGLALGIAQAGVGIGGAVWPLVAQWLIDSYSWRQAFTVLGLITFAIVVPLALFLKRSPEPTGAEAYVENKVGTDEQSLALTKGLPIGQAIRTGRFWLLGLVHFCFMFSVQVLVVHIAPYTIDIGFSALAASSIVSAIAWGSSFGRVAMGFISDKIGGRLALSICLIMSALSLIWLLFTKEIWSFYLFAMVFGLAWGGIVSVGTIVTSELFGLKYLGVVLGSVVLTGAFGGALGSPLAGTIFDMTQSYDIAFLICLALSMLAVICSVILFRYKVK